MAPICAKMLSRFATDAGARRGDHPPVASALDAARKRHNAPRRENRKTSSSPATTSYLVDFGIANAATDEADRNRHRGRTCAYMAPSASPATR